MALRTPISFVRRSAVKAARANRPRQAITIARPAEAPMMPPWICMPWYHDRMISPMNSNLIGRTWPVLRQSASIDCKVSGRR